VRSETKAQRQADFKKLAALIGPVGSVLASSPLPAETLAVDPAAIVGKARTNAA
jgi:hypothetical protein